MPRASEAPTGTVSKDARTLPLPADNLASTGTPPRSVLEKTALPGPVAARLHHRGIIGTWALRGPLSKEPRNPHVYYEIGWFLDTFPRLPTPPTSGPDLAARPSFFFPQPRNRSL
ncbi:hypothetical protein DPEC_G00350550 [Dallia pectoralis]|uniref:Uncharacterized protein n=1 Tax=Dallia pectoralis TaxID=75939 RepID=A0ACC2F1S2_DALPE|nr:hypothetical protein DPEC_G00350550 [Dallia pectoralis]